MDLKFHLSLPSKSIEETIEFYTNVIGANIGRKTNNWVDVDFLGNQLTFVVTEKFDFQYPFYALEDQKLPVFHFGVVLNFNVWEEMYAKITETSSIVIIKKEFFKNKKGEQYSFFIEDPNGYHIEFKTFKKLSEVFSMNHI